jgi:opacity protein-like surface antigen
LRSIAAVLAILATLALAAPSPAADRTGFQLEGAGVFASSHGSLPSSNGAPLTDLFGSSAGFSVTASMGVTRRVFGAVRVESYRGSRTGSDYGFSDLAGSGTSALPGSGPYRVERRLSTVLVTGLLQYRRPLLSHGSWHVEAGGGVASFKEKMWLSGSRGTLFDIPGYQREPAWAAGGGVAFAVPANTALTVGVRWFGSLTGDGAIFASGDKPSFFATSVGLRYPRVTH